MTFRLSNRSLTELEGVHPKLIGIVHEAIELTTQDFTVHSGLRSAREQNELYHRGASKLDGYRRKSKHQVQSDGYGHAVDLVPYVAGAGLRWEWPLIYPIAAAMALIADEHNVELRWGGVWDRSMSDYLPRGIGKLEEVAQKMREEVHAYTVRHPGPDFIDGPHYELQ